MEEVVRRDAQHGFRRHPAGVPALHFYEATPLNPAVGANPAAPTIYGVSEDKFDR